MNLLEPWNLVFSVGFAVYLSIRHVFMRRTRDEKKAVSRIDGQAIQLLEQPSPSQRRGNELHTLET